MLYTIICCTIIHYTIHTFNDIYIYIGDLRRLRVPRRRALPQPVREDVVAGGRGHRHSEGGMIRLETPHRAQISQFYIFRAFSLLENSQTILYRAI